MEPKKIQKLIETTYGKTTTGQPYYRLVWSEDLSEIRRGDFSYHSEGGIYLGTQYNVVDKVKKYEYLRDRWILEFYAPQLQALVAASNKEIVQSDGYEPLYVFQKKGGQYQKPEWWAIQYLVKRHRALLEHVEKRTEKMDQAEHEESVDREALQMMDYLENESSDLQNKFRYQEAVLIHRD